MKIWTSEHTFNHPWETVAQAAWRKYPNPMNPAVIGTDVVERKVVDGVLHSHRLVSSKWFFPRWAQALIGTAKICYASEKSEVNPQQRQMTLKTTNLSFCRYIAVDETVTYTPHPSDSSKTLLTQEAVVTVQIRKNFDALFLTSSVNSLEDGPRAFSTTMKSSYKVKTDASFPHTRPSFQDFQEDLIFLMCSPLQLDGLRLLALKDDGHHHGVTQMTVETGVPLSSYMEDLLANKISLNAGKGRQAIEWVIGKIDSEIKELASTAAKSTDELLTQTKKSLDDITSTARRSMDDISSKAKRSLDDIEKFTKANANQRS